MSATRLWQMNPEMEAAGISKFTAAMISSEELAAQWMARPDYFEGIELGFFLPLLPAQKKVQAKFTNQTRANRLMEVC